jgi:predicted naringenin-chalcone synthase
MIQRCDFASRDEGPVRALRARVLLTRFVATRPQFEIAQGRSLEWLAEVHAAAGANPARIAKALARVAPKAIDRRGHAIDEAELAVLVAQGTEARTRRYIEIVDEYFEDVYADEPIAPDDMIHVTCTGYVSPSGAQKVVAAKRWPTRVTHAYHMGCYAAVPALRVARGFVAAGSTRVDIVHSELCTLHMDPRQHSLEQLVVQSLFADGFIRYCAVRDQGTRGLRVLGVHERVLPDCADAMTWIVGDAGLAMTLSRDVPDRIASALRGFVTDMLRACGRDVPELARSVVAVHPGGPRIIDRVRDVLELSEAQVAASRRVLADCGNMSSATLPHIWKLLLEDPAVPPGTLIPSMAFGPGLTVCGAVLQKC